MTDLDRRILTKACGLEWRERMLEHGVINIDRNPTFTTPDDWELVREKVVVPNLNDFEGDFNLLSLYGWLLKSPEECCQDAANWIKSRPDLFPWVEKMVPVLVTSGFPLFLTPSGRREGEGMMEVIFTGYTKEQHMFGGHTGNPDELVIGESYSVIKTEVHAWHTKYYLKDHEGSFNSVCFEEKNGGSDGAANND